MIRGTAAALLALLAAPAAQDDSPPPDARVIRCVLDGQCRALVVPLGEGLWAAWDTSRGTLLKAWEGDVSWDGPVYTTVHGPQPTSRGDDLLDPLAGAAWMATVRGAAVPVAVTFGGYTLPDDAAVELHWRIALPNAAHVTVAETVRSEPRGADARPNLSRAFAPGELPPDTELALTAHGRPGAALNSHIATDGELRSVSVETEGATDAPSISASLSLRRDGPTHLRIGYAEPPPLPPPIEPIPAPESEPTRLPVDERRAALLAPPRELSDDARFEPGVALRLYEMEAPLPRLAPLVPGQTPNLHVLLRTLDLDGDRGDFEALGGPQDTFLAQATTRLHVDANGDYGLRLVSDDGSRLRVDGRMLIDHDGLHSAEAKEATVELTAGEHELEVWMFEAYGGEVLKLLWKPPGATEFSPIPEEFLSTPAGVVRVTAPGPKRTVTPLRRTRPGDAEWLAGVHPSFELHAARPPGFEPKVGGLALRPDGKLLVSTWDRDGAVYALTGAREDDPAHIQVQRIASGLAEPLGLCTVGARTFVLQKQELTELLDHDGDGVTDEYRCVCNAWPVSPNFHEFAFGLAERDGWLYANLAIAIDPGGRSSLAQAEGRGSVIRVHADDGRWERVAQGLRAPNGIGFGADLGWQVGDDVAARPLFIADNQGDWLPSSKILMVQDGAFYGNRSVLRERADGFVDTPPVVWLPQDEIGNSPSQPAPLPVGPWAGQMIVGDVTHGGLQRVAVQRVGDSLNGCVFAFSQGLEAGVNRLWWTPDGTDLFIGGIGSTGNWGQEGKRRFGLERLRYTGEPCFEMLDIRAEARGLRISLSEPLEDRTGIDPDGWLVKSWRYTPTESYGGEKLDERELRVTGVSIDEDRRHLFLLCAGLEAGRVVHVRALDPLRSTGGRALWTSEAWLTLNNLPPGELASPPVAEWAGYPWRDLAYAPSHLARTHELSASSAWHDADASPLPTGDWSPSTNWLDRDGTLVCDRGGDDLISNATFEDFDLQLDWRITSGGNSGIFFLVDETPRPDGSRPATWETGVEMQVLDNDGHTDGQHPLTSAAACYALYAPTHDDTRPVGHWNHVRIVKRGAHVEHWLNGRLQCAYDIGSDDWNARVAASKFASMPGFAKATRGHIALQDHGDEVAYRNIYLRELP